MTHPKVIIRTADWHDWHDNANAPVMLHEWLVGVLAWAGLHVLDRPYAPFHAPSFALAARALEHLPPPTHSQQE